MAMTEDELNERFAALEKNLQDNTAATTKLADDFAIVREWVESWQALAKVAETLGRWTKPIMKFSGWVAGIAAAYFGYKTVNPNSKP